MNEEELKRYNLKKDDERRIKELELELDKMTEEANKEALERMERIKKAQK